MRESSVVGEDTIRRLHTIEKLVGIGVILESFVIDRGHASGAEIHSVTDTGVILIKNERTGRLVTGIIARPEQIRRLYRSTDSVPPKKLIKLAYKHNALRYNEVI